MSSAQNPATLSLDTQAIVAQLKAIKRIVALGILAVLMFLFFIVLGLLLIANEVHTVGENLDAMNGQLRFMTSLASMGA